MSTVKMSIQLGRLVISVPTLQKILDFLPYPFLVSESKEGIRQNTFVNKKFLEEIGYTPEDMPTIHDWFLLAYPDEQYRTLVEDAWTKKMREAQLMGEDSVSMQVKIRTKSELDRWYEVKASTSSTQMVAFIDIHDSRMREENLERLNKNRDRILSILGHDLRGPLTHMYALSSMALNDQVSKEDFHKMIDEVNRKAFQTLEFLSTTLVWAKSNFDSITVRPENISVRKLCDTLAKQYAEPLESKKLKLSIEVDEMLTILSDREILTTVLRNLVSNAIKFSFENTIIAIYGQPWNDGVQLEVTDSGTGMDHEKIQQIKSGQQQSSIGTYGEKGLGIGLILCQDLLRHIYSSLDITSEYGRGTSIRINLRPLR